ncbi:hypothetical protein MTO96_036056, partial [Rhipicephalus appendiculatus]
MNAAIPPPPFLQCPGVPPIPWRQWRPVLQVYIDAAARDATPEHKKALLLNALGVEGLNAYLRAVEDEQQPGADRPTQEETPNVYDAALTLLSQLFDPQPDAACLRARFKALCQGPDESAVQFIQEVRRVAKLCEFGAASDILAFDQIISGIASPHLKRTFYKMGKDFTVQKALDIAKEDERVDRALLQLSGVQVDAVSSRSIQDSVSARRILQNAGPNGGRPPQSSPQEGAGGTSASISSPTGAADTSPASASARGGACYRCGSTRHWANSAACPAKSRTCSWCGRRGHFARVCRSTPESSAARLGTSTDEHMRLNATEVNRVLWTHQQTCKYAEGVRHCDLRFLSSKASANKKRLLAAAFGLALLVALIVIFFVFSGTSSSSVAHAAGDDDETTSPQQSYAGGNGGSKPTT